MADALLIHGVAGPAPAGPGEIAYDRRGYGANPGPEGYRATTVQEQSEDAARVIGEARVRVVGEDFGALVALDLALRHPHRVSALELRDPVVAQFVPEGASAVGHWLGRGSGPGFHADLRAATDWIVTRRELRALDAPVQFTVGAQAPAAVTATVAALRELLPHVR